MQLFSRDEEAIERIRSLEPAEGYWLGFSGGKDSVVVYDLMKRAGVAFDAHYNVTTVDAPEHVMFIRDSYPDVIFEHTGTTMMRMIVENRWPPTRYARYCCATLKERYGEGRIVATGVRWQESAKRKERRMVEGCRSGGNKTFLHPIIDWTKDDVWSYISDRGLAYSPLYDEGFTRVGCIMCPLKGSKGMERDALRWPKIAAAYERAMCRAYDARITAGMPTDFADGHEMFAWWMGRIKRELVRVERFTCEHCGKEFTRERSGGHRRPRYCCDAHRLDALNERRKAERAARRGSKG